MPNYVADALNMFQHTAPSRPQHAPHPWVKPTYGQKNELTELEDTPALLNVKGVNMIQKIIGKLYFYVRAVDHIMLVLLGEFSIKQTLGTASEKGGRGCSLFLNYAATHPNTVIQYHASGMVLHVDSGASYLSVIKARSIVGGHHYLSSPSVNGTKPPVTHPLPNGPLRAVCSVMKNGMVSAVEAEVGGLFLNGQELMILRTTLEELGHQQPPTPIKTDNSTTSGITNKTIRQRRYRSMNMIFYWVRDREQ